MLFRSPDPERLIHLSNTLGHTCVVGAEFAELPAMFQRDAVLAGAEVSGVMTPEIHRAAALMKIDKDAAEAARIAKEADAARSPKWLEEELAASGVRIPR